MRWVGNVDREIIKILYSLLVGKPKGKDLLEHTGVDGRTLLKQSSKKQDGNKTAVIWLK
jgi:hypothetical protein